MKRFLSYFILLLTIFFSMIFIASQNEESQKLKILKEKIKQEIYKNLSGYKENLYTIEKEKIKNNNPKTPAYGVIILDKNNVSG